MTTVVSDNFIYERIPNATDGYSYRTKLNSEASSYQLGETVRIPIPPVAHGFMNTSNTFINVTMECVVDGTVLAGADSTGAGNLVHSWIGINAAWDRIDFIGPNGQSINMQQNQQAIFATNLLANSDYSAAFPNSITNKTAIAQSRGGTQALEGNPVEGSANAAKTKFTSTKNHYSPTLQGLLSGAKSIPLTWFDSDCYLELYITPDIKNMLYNGDALGTITGVGEATFTVDLDCQIDVVTDNSLREIQQHAGFGSGPVSWSDINQRASLHSISAAELNSTSEFLKTNVINGVRPRKLLNVIQTAFQRNATGHHDRWSCVNPYESWFLRLGSANYPPRPMSTDAEMTAHLLECYNQNSYSTNGNRLSGGQYSGRFPTSTAAVYDVKRGAVGLDFTQYDNSADGVDATSLILESLGNIKLDSTQTSASAYEVYTIRTFGVLYSVDNSGNFSISY